MILTVGSLSGFLRVLLIKHWEYRYVTVLK
jgi:hypothetical protein